MLRLNDRERKMVIGGSGFLAILAAYFFLIGPFLQSKSELSGKLEDSYQLYQDYRSILADEKIYQKHLQTRKDEMLAVSRLLLSGNTSSLAAAELSNKVGDIADESDVSITRKNENQPVAIDKHQRISIQLNMSCDIISLQDFLERIESDPNLLVINSLEVNAPASMRRAYRKGRTQRGQRSASENLRVTMTISGYIDGEEISFGGER
jgi:hypothetical protein